MERKMGKSFMKMITFVIFVDGMISSLILILLIYTIGRIVLCFTAVKSVNKWLKYRIMLIIF